MKKEAVNNFAVSMKNTKSQSIGNVISKPFNEEEEAPELEDTFNSKNEDDDFVEPKGPKKEDLKKNIVFLDDDDDDDDF